MWQSQGLNRGADPWSDEVSATIDRQSLPLVVVRGKKLNKSVPILYLQYRMVVLIFVWPSKS